MMCLQPLGKSLDTIEEGKMLHKLFPLPKGRTQSDLMQELCDCNY